MYDLSEIAILFPAGAEIRLWHLHSPAFKFLRQVFFLLPAIAAFIGVFGHLVVFAFQEFGRFCHVCIVVLNTKMRPDTSAQAHRNFYYNPMNSFRCIKAYSERRLPSVNHALKIAVTKPPTAVMIAK